MRKAISSAMKLFTGVEEANAALTPGSFPFPAVSRFALLVHSNDPIKYILVHRAQI